MVTLGTIAMETISKIINILGHNNHTLVTIAKATALHTLANEIAITTFHCYQ